MADKQKFRGQVRFFRPEQAAGLAVIDIPEDVAIALGGLKQMKVRGRINGQDFTSNTMPAGNRRLALSASKAMLKAAGLVVGDTAEIEIQRV